MQLPKETRQTCKYQKIKCLWWCSDYYISLILECKTYIILPYFERNSALAKWFFINYLAGQLELSKSYRNAILK